MIGELGARDAAMHSIILFRQQNGLEMENQERNEMDNNNDNGGSNC